MDQPNWTEPGAFWVADGIHRIPLPLPMDGLRAVNVYVIETDEGLTLLDGGWALEVSRRQLETSLRTIGYHPRDITSFLVTHSHRDHYTQAIAIRSEFGRAAVSLGVGDKPVLDLFGDRTLDADPTVARLQLIGAPDLADEWARWVSNSAPDFSVWQAPDRWLEGRHEIAVGHRTLQAIPTPGHTQGHFVFADEAEGVLFAGDHVLPSITPSIGFEPVYAEQPLHDYLASLAVVRALPDMRLLPAHGPITEGVHARVDELLDHHDVRLRLCLEAVPTSGCTAYDVAGHLPWTRHHRRLDELDVFNRGLAAMESMVHLDLLVLRGGLVSETVHGRRVYHPASAPVGNLASSQPTSPDPAALA